MNLPLEQQIVSLELSKQLKEAGYEQEGIWWWNIDTAYKNPRIVVEPTGKWAEFNIIKHCIVAPTVAELGKRLPVEIEKDLDYYRLDIEKENKYWRIRYYYYTRDYGDEVLHTVEADTLANAMAEMWLYLKERGLIK